MGKATKTKNAKADKAKATPAATPAKARKSKRENPYKRGNYEAIMGHIMVDLKGANKPFTR